MKSKKKGFTLVELLVVIAILAVLATVTTVGYLSFTNKAKESNDISLTTELNTILMGNVAEEGKNKTPHEAVLDLKEEGFDITRLTPTKGGYEFVWDSIQDKFFLLDGDKVVSPTDGVLSSNKLDIFKFIGKDEKLNDTYSNYLKPDYVSINGIETISTSFDSGTNTSVKEVHYINNSGNKKNIYIRTNGENLIVDAITDTVTHYGNANVVDVKNVDSQNCYHEAGSSQNLVVENGKVVIQEQAYVMNLNIPEKSTNVTLEINDLAVVVKAEDPTNKIPSEEKNKVGITNLDTKTVALVFDEFGIKEVTRFEDAIYKTQNKTIVLLNDIDLSYYKNDANYIVDLTNTILNLNNHKITISFMGVIFVGKKFIIQNGGFNAINGNYSLWIGDAPVTKDVILDNLILNYGLNIYNSSSIVINNVKATGRNHHALWFDSGVVDVEVKSGIYKKGTEGFSILKSDNAKNITVTGGSFDTDPTAFIPESYQATLLENVWNVSKK